MKAKESRSKEPSGYKGIFVSMQDVLQRLKDHKVGGDIARKHKDRAVELLSMAVDEIKESILQDQ